MGFDTPLERWAPQGCVGRTKTLAWALREDFSLVGQERERDVVDGESKCVCHNIIENCDLPLGLAVLQLDRKHAILCEFFAVQIV